MEIVCFSHLRWDFVYQRPQHLLTRFAKQGKVHYWEEPIFEDRKNSELKQRVEDSGVAVLTPVLRFGLSSDQSAAEQRQLLDDYICSQGVEDFVSWYYTPMSLQFSDHLSPTTIVYDCMDELSAFQGASPELISEEQRLLSHADVVFAGGASLYASKKKKHANIHLFPSSIDYAHFAQAREPLEEPADQASIPHPRVGFFGVLDERLDCDLLRQLASKLPDLHFVLLGPVVKIREAELPKGENLHYLGRKSYSDLPIYLSGWDVAMLPFARNASTQFISPTKTPEYLAGGKRAVSTPITDVVSPYGEKKLVFIGATADEFAQSIEHALANNDHAVWLKRVDAFLAESSWDKTFDAMRRIILQHESRTMAPSAALGSVMESPCLIT